MPRHTCSPTQHSGLHSGQGRGSEEWECVFISLSLRSLLEDPSYSLGLLSERCSEFKNWVHVVPPESNLLNIIEPLLSILRVSSVSPGWQRDMGTGVRSGVAEVGGWRRALTRPGLPPPAGEPRPRRAGPCGPGGKREEAFRPAAPCPREPLCRWPATDDFTGCVVETRASR